MRKLKNWLESYQNYARDAYCPDSFHLWTGLSVLAGALERKVWAQNGRIVFHPNLFVLLVTYPGVGKSTAIVRGVDFLERLKAEINPEINIVAEQITEPGLVKQMEFRQEMLVNETSRVFHSSGYFYASEASSSALQNTHGSFTATITGFYDCPRVFRKVTKGEHDKPTEIHNVCFNLLSGATFDYLKTLVNESSVMGGFASRIIYVINKERLIREPKWGESLSIDLSAQEDLFSDLVQIHALKGAFKPTRGFVSAWEDFQPVSDRALAELNSPRLESLAARKSVNTMKIAMLLSVAESNDLTLEVRHWDRAMELIEEVSCDNAFILSQGAMADKNSQLGIKQAAGHALLKNPEGILPMHVFKAMIMKGNFRVEDIESTVNYMAAAQLISFDGAGNVKLLIHPDRYL